MPSALPLRSVVAVLLALVATAWPCIAVGETKVGDWPQFRGPRGDGTSDGRNLPTHWGGFESPRWQTAVPGRGWSSPIVTGDRVWLTSSEQVALPTDQLSQKLSEGLYRDFAEQFQAHSSVSLYAIEFDLASGELLRKLEVLTVEDPPPIHATNTYASPTPVTDGERIYCHFGSLGTVAVEVKSGKVVWNRRFAIDDITGPGSSPVLVDNKLIVPCDGVDQQFVVALDTQSGETLWKAARPPIEFEGKHRRAFSTPLLIEHEGRQQLVVPGAQWVVAYDPADGAEIWRVNFGDGHATIPRPVYRAGLVYICTGYMKPQLWAIRVDGRGDVTETHVAWKCQKQVPEISSPIVIGDEIYFVSSLGVLSCLDAATGATCWQHRIGGNYAASPIAGAQLLYFFSREGTATVLRPGRTFDEVARNEIFGQTMASPAIANDSILLRTESHLYCLKSRTAND